MSTFWAMKAERELTSEHPFEYECDACGEVFRLVRDAEQPCPDRCPGTLRAVQGGQSR